jgi:1,4-alpha-glucan branching enzyme
MTSVTENGDIEFRFYRPSATCVAVSGDFNGWSNNALVMRPTGDGWWTAVAPLAEGEYRFKYFADGQWFPDYAANGVEQTKLGWISLLLVRPAPGMQYASRAAA